MAERVQISHYYTTGNSSPDLTKLTYGELALSLSAGSESIYFKNTNNNIATFSCDDKFLKQNNTFNGINTFGNTTNFNALIGIANDISFLTGGGKISALGGLNIMSLSSPINITGPINVTGITYLKGNTTISATTFNVTGTTNIKGVTNINGNTTITGTTSLKGNTNISASTVNVTGTTNINGNTTITGTCTSTNGFYDTSDERLKTFGEEVSINLDKIKNIKKSYFHYKYDENKEKHIGVSAQDIEKIYPEITNINSDGYLTVDYSKLSVIALKAIDVLHEENTILKLKLIELEERLNKLENK